MFGILNINKPAGWTSRDVVNRVQRLVRPAKAGHAGTLDPLATGVLLVCVGPATKLISYVQQQQKEYEATFLLGRSSPSDDVETEICELDQPPIPTREAIEAKLPEFVGTIQQRPPLYSAIKVKGQRAYKLARGGSEMELPARPVEIYELSVTACEYPQLCLKIRCGSGTYVRSIGRDLANSLGTAAVMSALTRTAIGEFSVQEGLDVESLEKTILEQQLVSPLQAVAHLPQVILSESQQTEIQHGRMITVDELAISPQPDEVFAAVGSDGQLLALMQMKRAGLIGPTCNFSQSS